MSTTLSTFRPELLQVADAVAREKGIDRDEVLDAMEQAIQKAGRSKYGHELDIRATIDRSNGEIVLARYREVADPEEIENEATQLTPEMAARIDPEKKIGDFIVDPLPPIDFGRIAAQTAKQVIVQKVREAERHRQYEEYKDRVGEVVHGVVKRVEFGNVMVDMGRAEAIIRREELIPRESFRQGDRVRAFIYDVREEQRGPQIFLSRTHPQFMAKLFTQEVPEIYDGIIEIKAVARDSGSRAKIAVMTNDSSIDPVGACVGMRGSRVQAVVGELQGEKIDIIPWSPDPATFVVNALAPAEVTKVVLDEDTGTIEVVVPDDQQSLAIGRRGQNVRLASQLTGWHIDIMTEAAESERRQEEFRTRSQMFIDALDVDDVIAHLLVTEGFSALEEVAFVPIEDLTAIEAFDEEIAEALRERAQDYLTRRDEEFSERRRSLGVEDAVSEIEGLSPGMLVKLGEAEVKTVEDVADLSTDELRFILLDKKPTISPDDLGHVKDETRSRLLAGLAPDEEGRVPATLDILRYLKPHKVASLVSPSTLDEQEAETIIMAARAGWFDDEEPVGDEAAAEEAGAEATDGAEAAGAETADPEPDTAKEA